MYGAGYKVEKVIEITHDLTFYCTHKDQLCVPQYKVNV